MAADDRTDDRPGQGLNPLWGTPSSTIFGLSSGAPPSAIAIVRVSGPRAGDALVALAGALPPPRYASYRSLRDAEGFLLDHALILWFPGPQTSTGEDLAELHLHGGRAILAAVMAALAKLPGLEPAEAGAFTRRAFANGRIDLTQAEGLADMLAAESESQRRQALHLAEGGLGRVVESWRPRLLDIAAQIEAAIDHDDEGDVPQLAIGPALQDLIDEIEETLRSPPAERLRDGARVVLAGPPNSGKSSLFNALAGRDAVIVSPIAGTTRDVIEAPLLIGDAPILLIDTAGLTETDDPIETIGVTRANDVIDTADLVLWLGKSTDGPTSKVLRIQSKCDIAMRREDGSDIAVSAKTGANLTALRNAIVQRTMVEGGGSVALNVRQRTLISNAADELTAAFRLSDPLLAAEHIRSGLAAIDQVVGRSGTEDMLSALFGRFCIGK